MTDRLHDDELFTLVRKALPEVDVDAVSATGAQARAVLDRVSPVIVEPWSIRTRSRRRTTRRGDIDVDELG